MSSETSQRKFKDRFLFSMVWEQIRNNRLIFWVSWLMLLLNVILAIAAPYMFNLILLSAADSAKPSKSYIIQAVGLYVAFSVLSWIARSIQFMNMAKLNARVIKGLRDRAFGRVLNNQVGFYDEQQSGELTARIVNDTRELSESGKDIAWVITNLFQVAFVLVFFFYLSPIIALITTLFIPVIVGVSFVMGKWERRVSKTWRDRFAIVNARFSDIMSKIAISKTFNREQENLNRFQTINDETYDASVKRGFAIFLFWPLTDLMQHALRLLIIVFGVYLIEHNGLELTTFIMFNVLLGFFYWPTISIASNYHRFQSAAASLERIAVVSEDDTLQEVDHGDVLADNLTGKIVFDNVSFSYIEDTPVLQNISFSINPGERIALVGHTGAGKSTIASLLVRFYDNQQGTILLDDTAITNYNLQSLRKHISLVSQRVLLFKGSIRENLLVANPDATDADIWDVLDQVQAREFIELLPHGIDSQVEENGKNLSAGQKQMISFARALLSDPRVIILDEATSSVDLYTEAKIQDAIDTILNSRTSISIAHRLTTIMKSDKIIVMDHGKIIEIGTHEELVVKGGLYAEMYNLYLQTQSAKYLEKIRVK